MRAGSLLRVIAGRVNGLAGPVRERPTRPLLLTLALEDDRPFELELPAGHTAFAFVGQGEVAMGPEGGSSVVGPNQLAVLGPGNRLRRAPPTAAASC